MLQKYFIKVPFKVLSEFYVQLSYGDKNKTLLREKSEIITLKVSKKVVKQHKRDAGLT